MAVTWFSNRRARGLARYGPCWLTERSLGSSRIKVRTNRRTGHPSEEAPNIVIRLSPPCAAGDREGLRRFQTRERRTETAFADLAVSTTRRRFPGLYVRFYARSVQLILDRPR